jgi:hypothetical protein
MLHCGIKSPRATQRLVCNPGVVSLTLTCFYASAAVNWFENKVNQFTAARTPYEPGLHKAAHVVRHFKSTMRIHIIIGTLVLLTSCNLAERERTQRTINDTVISQIDTTLSLTDNSAKLSYSDTFDSLSRAYVDTSTLKGKRSWLMNQFLIENGLVSPDYDTLLDLTYDGNKDYIIGYYGKSGTGIKNIVNVYLFNPRRHSYIFDEKLSDLPNPTFYIKQKKITGFYIGNGGGSGVKLEWIKSKWRSTKEFSVNKNGDSTKWNIYFPLSRKRQEIIQPFQMIPPKNILETDITY